VLVKDWAIVQLVEDFGLGKRVTVTGVGGEVLSDQELAAMYQACQVTLLPSLGEGFGFTLIESLASGVPVVHSQWAGGETYVPKLEWKVPVRERRIESVYAIVRPVMRAEDWANATERALRWRQQENPQVVREYLQGSVAHLDWQALWGRWSSWFKQGLQ
jgi:glycosyltransferase involved in cell wall biosynthesis